MQSGHIKFRLTDDERKSFFDAARKADMTVSVLLRRAGRAFASGRIASRSVLDDLVATHARVSLGASRELAVEFGYRRPALIDPRSRFGPSLNIFS